MNISAITWLALGGASMLELAVVLTGAWRLRRLLVPCLIPMLALCGGLLMGARLTIATVLCLAVILYRIVNLLRVAENRMHERYLRHVVRRSSLWLLALQAAVFMVDMAATRGLNARGIILVLQVLVAAGLLACTIINIRRSRPNLPQPHTAQRDLPTVSVLVPARNETDDLLACLRTVMASDYPKLEVIALDDCSRTNTADIIKQFAHDGVRFISGDPPRANWLARNQAYDALTDAANGELVLFCGVDTRFEPHSISRLVELFIDNKLKMLDVLPQRPTYSPLAFIIQPLRYWWELALPRFAMKQPPSVTSCWLIERRALKAMGAFDAVSRRVRPETYFARELQAQHAYQFILGSAELGITNHKSPREQFDSAIRLRYPDMHKQPEGILALTTFEATFMLLPFLQLPYGILTHRPLVAALSVISIALLTLTHLIILYYTNNPGTLAGVCNYPLVALAELYLANLSMWRYEFGTVSWKDRNICLPIMHVTPRLPKLDKPKVQS